MEETREEFVRRLEQKVQRWGWRVTLVFDGGAFPSSPFPFSKQHGRIRVLFSPPPLSADDYILEFLHYRRRGESLVVVTSDKGLSQKVGALGVPIASIDCFLKRLSLRARRETLGRGRGKPDRESPHHIDRLKKIFEDRLNRGS